MKSGKLFLFLCAAGFLLALPVVWIVASLAADLRAFHPVAGWAVWVATAVAVLCLLLPIAQFLRLPSMPPSGLLSDESPSNGEWQRTAKLLVETCDDPAAVAELQRYIRDLPNDLGEAIAREIKRRRAAASGLRTGAVRQAATLSILSPHRQMDMLILFWINLRQVYFLSRCYGFKPSPRGIFRLYAGVFGSAVALESFDEVAEQSVVELSTRLAGGIPLAGEAAKFIYDPLRAAAYVGFVGLLTEFLLKHELKRPPSSERKSLRRTAWTEATAEVASVGAAWLKPSPDVAPTSSQG